MGLAGSPEAIYKKLVDIVYTCADDLIEVMNNIETTIDGLDVTIRLFIQNGGISSFDAFVGLSERDVLYKIIFDSIY